MKRILNRKAMFPDRNVYDIKYSDTLMDLIQRLLDKNKESRLGSEGDAAEILAHPFFEELELDKVETKSIEPPLMPPVEDETADKNPKK